MGSSVEIKKKMLIRFCEQINTNPSRPYPGPREKIN